MESTSQGQLKYYSGSNSTQNMYFVPQNLIQWINTNISHPIKGFEHKRDRHGKILSSNEQLLQTKQQLLTIAHYFYEHGKSSDAIVEILKNFK